MFICDDGCVNRLRIQEQKNTGFYLLMIKTGVFL